MKLWMGSCWGWLAGLRGQVLGAGLGQPYCGPASCAVSLHPSFGSAQPFWNVCSSPNQCPAHYERPSNHMKKPILLSSAIAMQARPLDIDCLQALTCLMDDRGAQVISRESSSCAAMMRQPGLQDSVGAYLLGRPQSGSNSVTLTWKGGWVYEHAIPGTWPIPRQCGGSAYKPCC